MVSDESPEPTLRSLADRIGTGEAINRIAALVGERLKLLMPEGVDFVLVLSDRDGPDRVYISNQDRDSATEVLAGLLTTLATRGAAQ